MICQGYRHSIYLYFGRQPFKHTLNFTQSCWAKSWLFNLDPLLIFGPFFAESFCTKVLHALKTSFSQLEEKTRLELQLLQSDPQFWKVALRDKLLRVSQLFSSQATDQIHFNDAESRWAYLGTYTAAHATLVQATVTSGRFEPLTEFIRKCNSKDR